MEEREPSGVRLIRFLEAHRQTILRREQENEASVHLYGVGDYWIALERSAYQLMRQFPQCELYPMQFVDSPFPVVLAAITDRELRRYGQRHIFRQEEPDYRQLTVPVMSAVHYRNWHRNLCRVLK